MVNTSVLTLDARRGDGGYMMSVGHCSLRNIPKKKTSLDRSESAHILPALDPFLSAAKGGLLATRCRFNAYQLTHWGARGAGSILRATHRKG